VTVKLSQSLLFDETKCGSNARDPVDFALLTFAVYQKPNDAEKKCDVHLKKDACWSTNIVVACDPATNQAAVDLYTRDIYHLDRLKDIVENPKVAHEFGICIGPMDYVSKTVRHTGTFNCAAPVPPKHNIYGECETSENCPDSQWCSELPIYNDFAGGYPELIRAPGGGEGRRLTKPPYQELVAGKACKDFVKPGSPCGSNNFLPPGLEDRCDAQEATCVEYSSCTGIQGPLGRCVAYEGDCTSSTDCGPESLCDSSSGQCMAKGQLNDCCGEVPCHSDFICHVDFSPAGSISTCQQGPPVEHIGVLCETDSNCPRTQWCSDELDGGFGSPGENSSGTPLPPGSEKTCKEYTTVGQECRPQGGIPPQPEARCDADQGVECVAYTGCFEAVTDPLSRCVAFEGKCGNNQECDPDSYCALAGFCMAKFQRGDCCDALTAPCAAPYECVESFGPFGSKSTCQ
jgi:hypothetical protein